ncbi:zinc knuckle CX2CX4HX4C containing protein [Tanacetum coccineum]
MNECSASKDDSLKTNFIKDLENTLGDKNEVVANKLNKCDPVVDGNGKSWPRNYGYKREECLRRMWSRHGFKDIIDTNNGVYFIKFHNDEGLEVVVNNRPWVVNNKPLLVQKWDISMCLDKSELVTIPIWIKMYNDPLEA